LANTIRADVGIRDNASGPIDKIRDKFERLQKQGAKGLAIGAGAAITTAALNLVGNAIGRVTDFLGDSARAYQEDERSQVRFRTSLTANVAAFDGNTDAIEKILQARIKLGFSDDEQRDSLATLVTRTHDSTEALRLQQIAMDLARLRGLDLATASDLIGKAFSGQVGALRRAGIAVDANATATEALAAVEKAAAGQAENFAKSQSGSIVVANIRAAETMERFGKVITHIQAAVLPLLVDALEGTADVLDEVGAAAKKVPTPFFLKWIDDARAAEAGLHRVAEGTEDLRRATGRLTPGLKTTAGATEDLTEEQADLEYWFGRTTRAASEQDDALARLSGEMFGTEILTGDLAQAQKDLDEILKAGPESQKAADIAIWNGRVAEQRQRVFELQAQMAQGAGPAAFYQWLLLQEQAIGNTDAALLEYIRNLKWLALVQQAPFTEQPLPLVPRSGAPQPYAHGGPVMADEPIIVGEKGPEIFVPPSAGQIVPNGGSGGWSAGGQFEIHTHLYLDGRQIAEVVNREQDFRRGRGTFVPA
jgi:hypothetical protein